jgi:2-polyprenyl-6-hydroxyphenyl methylase/3-demethylubiquinone-9 3-methyltransferase
MSGAAEAATPGVIYETVRAPEEYIRAYNELMSEPTNRLRVRAVTDILRHIDSPVHRVVDVASGGGAYVDAARAAIPGQPRFFAADRQFACVGGYRINHPWTAGALADVTKLPFRSESFDVAMCLDIIEHLDDDVAFLRDVGRLIRPGGWVVVSTHNSRSLTHVFGLATSALRGRRWLGWDPTHVRFYDEHSLRTKLTAAGFEPVAFNGTYYLPFHLPARAASWPLERLGLKSVARAVYKLVRAPFYALNYPFEKWSGTPMLCAFGWGIVVLARRR